ncbi:MAG: hypothetical protein IPK23_15045 [Rhizobiales bacterium]|nr:hypothetical protein [Hyphomicrobiales bacterium]
MVQDRREARKAWVPPYKIGDIFRTCWGYDQTNVEFFELVALRGKTGVLRELKQERVEEGWARGKCVPLPGEYICEPIRRQCREHGFKISSCQIAYPAAVETVAGVRVVKPASWTAYA